MKLFPGFRFHPTDVELVLYYLKRKVMGKKLLFNAIAEVDIYKFAPWDLPDKSCMINGDLKWYFFCPAEKKYARGARLKRSTEFGYWKTTGRDRPVHYNNKVMGLIKTLIFHRGKAPKGDRTDWVMHEYRLEDYALADCGVIQNAYLLCIVFRKDGRGPQNGAQYGAPFQEEDWSDDEEEVNEEVNCAGVESYGGSSAPTLPQPINRGSFISTRSCASESMCTGSSCVSCPLHRGQSSYEMPCISEDNFITTSSRGPEVMCNGSLHVPGPSNGVYSAYEMLPSVSGNIMDLVNSAQPMDDEILSLLAPFSEQDNLSLNENDKDKELNCCSGVGYLEGAPNCEGNDIRGNLSDSSNPNGQNACGCTKNSAASDSYESW